ncbi:hypothetical protein LTS18_005779 [Coniosporium uncinatum]|uniref:Uncharacterized protein n=1 Tax=Coniosporium uncinatum TaxID=93489 RepID=A0ACC3D477_9PEZI|nr:hypothetical protein LTS18_005779 [Coniosporium uncinatum]
MPDPPVPEAWERDIYEAASLDYKPPIPIVRPEPAPPQPEREGWEREVFEAEVFDMSWPAPLHPGDTGAGKEQRVTGAGHAGESSGRTGDASGGSASTRRTHDTFQHPPEQSERSKDEGESLSGEIAEKLQAQMETFRKQLDKEACERNQKESTNPGARRERVHAPKSGVQRPLERSAEQALPEEPLFE